MESLYALACPMPKGLLAFVVAFVVGFFHMCVCEFTAIEHWKIFLWLLAIVVGGAALAYRPLVHFCAA